MEEFDPLKVSGIAATSMQDTLSFDVVRWLVKQVKDVEIVWDEGAAERALDSVWPRFIPLIEEDGHVEADVPWQRWLHAAKGRREELQWLVQQLESMSISDVENIRSFSSHSLKIY